MATMKKIKSNARSTAFAKFFGADSVDCRFQFIDEATNEVKEIAAHQKVMSGNSPVLAAMFNGNWNENTNAVVIKDASYEAFDSFVKYFYQDEFEMTAQNVVDLLTLADKYDVQDLVAHCETFMLEQLSTESVLKYFEIAERFGRSGLKAACVRLFLDKPKDILQSELFSGCDITTLATFLRMLPKICDAAMVFDASIGWAKRRCEENDKDETCMNNLRTELGECFELIRFKEMSFEAMAERYKTYKILFTKDETDDIFEYLLDNARSRDYLHSRVKCIGVREAPSGSISSYMAFKIKKRMLLDEITLADTFTTNEGKNPIAFSAVITITAKEQVIATHTAEFTVDNMSFTFPQKVFVEAGVVHEINVRRKLDPHFVHNYKFKQQQFNDVGFIPIKYGTNEIVEQAYSSIKEIIFVDINN